MTTHDGEADIYRALDAGACGYLIKDMLGDELIKAIRMVAAGNRNGVRVPTSRRGPAAELTGESME